MPRAHKDNYIIDYTVMLNPTEDISVANYTYDRGGLTEVLTAVRNPNLWTPQFAIDRGSRKNPLPSIRVTGFTYPNADGHPGHKDNSAEAAWKYQIQRGAGSDDRLVIRNGISGVPQNTEYNVDGNEKYLRTLVNITFTLKVLKNTKG